MLLFQISSESKKTGKKSNSKPFQIYTDIASEDSLQTEESNVRAVLCNVLIISAELNTVNTDGHEKRKELVNDSQSVPQFSDIETERISETDDVHQSEIKQEATYFQYDSETNNCNVKQEFFLLDDVPEETGFVKEELDRDMDSDYIGLSEMGNGQDFQGFKSHASPSKKYPYLKEMLEKESLVSHLNSEILQSTQTLVDPNNSCGDQFKSSPYIREIMDFEHYQGNDYEVSFSQSSHEIINVQKLNSYDSAATDNKNEWISNNAALVSSLHLQRCINLDHSYCFTYEMPNTFTPEYTWEGLQLDVLIPNLVERLLDDNTSKMLSHIHTRGGHIEYKINGHVKRKSPIWDSDVPRIHKILTVKDLHHHEKVSAFLYFIVIVFHVLICKGNLP